MFQTRPLTVTVAPPFEEIFPPPVAEEVAILVTGSVVVRVGTTGSEVVNVPSEEYPVPVELVAYPR